MKHVLITGANSYIGKAFRKWAETHYPDEFQIEALSIRNDDWKKRDFSSYDCLFHCAGIAHADTGKVSEARKAEYYRVNRDLAVEVAEQAKADGVKQFVFMSSAIVYGDSAPYGKRKRITKDTPPAPANFYGDSKWQADQIIRELADESFTVTVLRPPMIYGRGSKGNYPALSKLARKLPVFPDVPNERSMLYIDNLTEFLCRVILCGDGGVFWPQNAEYVKTSDLVREIADVTGHRIFISKAFNWAVGAVSGIPGKAGDLANKAFGSLSYDQSMSEYDFPYRVADLKESVRRTERGEKKALMLASVASMIDQFNMPNIRLLQSLGYHVDVVADYTNPGNISEERATGLIKRLETDNAHAIDIAVPRSLNPKTVISAYRKVRKLIITEQYDLIHCHSPIGGAITRLAARRERRKGTRVIYTAHGFHFYTGAPLKNWLVFYPIEKWLSRYTDVLITINREDYQRAAEKFKARKTIYIPGIGVDTVKFGTGRHGDKIRSELGLDDSSTMLLSVGELNDNKNHEAVIRALGKMKTEGELPDNLYYIIVGKGNKKEELKNSIKLYGLDDRIKLVGFRNDVADFYDAADVFVFPSFREGLSVSLMEAMASGLPVACSRIRGNTDLVDKNGGMLFDPTDENEVQSAVEMMLTMDTAGMGEYNKKIIAAFDRSVIDSIMKSIYNNTACEEGKTC